MAENTTGVAKRPERPCIPQIQQPERAFMSEPVSVYISDQVRAIERLHSDLFTDEFRRLSVREQLDRQAQRILAAHQAGDPTVIPHITCWHPTLACESADAIMAATFTLQDARETIAREYGFASWPDAEVHGTEPPDPTFEFAVDTLLRGDIVQLRALLVANPALIRQRSSYGHRATLLHYVGSNGVETYRQRVPLNLAAVTELLLSAGAEVNAAANMYGGSTVLGLLLTSDHPAQAGVAADVAEVLRNAGAW